MENCFEKNEVKGEGRGAEEREAAAAENECGLVSLFSLLVTSGEGGRRGGGGERVKRRR